MKLLVLVIGCLLSVPGAIAQTERWQQRVKYAMEINMDVNTNRFTGKQKLEYSNNSPDTLRRVFYHLYWNAFQPNSMMDVHSRELGKITTNRNPEWDPRVTDRISKLTDDEIGYQKILSLSMNGVVQKFTVHETILEVQLTQPILPKSKVVFDMNFESQVPIQIRRSGRDAANGVKYSMSQWYPKICEYDYDGWHPTPYVAREFYGVWGDFDVKITIDKNYILGGTGYLQNANQVGYGYEAAGIKVTRPAGEKLTWHFVAPNVHDFMWAADPEYRHLVRTIPGGPVIHVLYNRDEAALQAQFDTFGDSIKARYGNQFSRYLQSIDDQWNAIADASVAVFPFIEKNFGEYAYRQFSFIHGGDGGTEYPMSTLMSAPRLGTAFHELVHSWYYMMLATNESLYYWMDEGFTEWVTDRVEYYYRDVVIRKRDQNSPASLRIIDSLGKILPKYHEPSYRSYLYIAKSGLEEPLTTHADHFRTASAYSEGAYSKGAVFLAQLGYIVGESVRDKIMLEYYRQWRFKHPNVHDFFRVAEKVSNMKLDWYWNYWINTTKTIDYKIDDLVEEGGKSKITIRRIGEIPMPLDIIITYKDGTSESVYIPMDLMFGSKANDTPSLNRSSFPAWKWTHPTYTFELNRRLGDIKIVEIDPSQRMADIDRRNNKLDIPSY